MRGISLLLAVLVLGTAPVAYHIDLTRYFSAPAAEASTRAKLLVDAQRFVGERVSPRTPGTLRTWLVRYTALLNGIERDDIYVYLRSELDVHDAADAAADESFTELERAVDAKADAVIAALGSRRIAAFEQRSAALRPYAYALQTALVRSRHAVPVSAQRAVALTADRAIAAAGREYEQLRRTGGERHAPAYAALLLSIATLRNGIARVRGFSGAPNAAYFDQSLSGASVRRVLAAVRASDAMRRFEALPAAPVFAPPAISLEQAISDILAAERPMGATIVGEYANLLDPRTGRAEICTAASCDHAGFSLGFGELRSAVFFGGYHGTLDNARALSHEAAHAVHRELMAEHQPIALYTRGPNFMFESFAIFNELRFYDHLAKTATSAAARTYYQRRFLDDATFQIFGSAEETDLEASIYRRVAAGSALSSSDLDALTQRVFARYDPRLAAEPRTRHYWIRDRLYYTDPLYDVNYLYAGLLALEYLHQFEADPSAFARRYVALESNGFTAPPDVLERRFLGIELDDEAGLVRNATALIDARTAALEAPAH